MLDIGGHLRGLLRFGGRERRTTFWLWIAMLIGSTMVIAVAGMALVIGGTMTRMQQFAASHPDQATVTQTGASYSIEVHGAHPELTPPFQLMLTVWAIITALIVGLFAAAVARRLHDAGKSALWGLMPLPFLFGGYAGMAHLFASFGSDIQPDMNGFFLLFANNLIYLAALLALVILCCLPTQEHANRYGPPPGRGVG